MPGHTTVAFGSNEGKNVEVTSPTEAKATSPAASAGTVDVEVTTPGGTSAAGAGDKFTYGPPPNVTGIQPNFGPTGGGTKVTITGTHFLGATSVTFGATAASEFKVESETQISTTSPAGSGTVDIVVTAPTGPSATGQADTFAYESLAPTFASSFGEAGSGSGQLGSPTGVTLDSSGNVWVSDSANNRVDEFSSGGAFKLAFGWGVKDGEGKLETCTESCRAGLTGSGNGEFGSGDVYSLRIGAIAVYGNDVWVVDGGNDRIEEFTTSGEFVTAIGTLIGPTGIAVTSSGDVWVVSIGYGALQEFEPSGKEAHGYTSTYDRSAESPSDLSVDAQGNVWVATTNFNRIEEYSPAGAFTQMFGWGVKDGEAKLETCTAECKRGIAGSGNGQLTNPTGIAIDGANTLWVVDSGNNRVERFTLADEYLTQFGSVGSGPGQLSEPWGIAATNGSLYVADQNNNRIERWTHIAPVFTSLEPSTGPEAGGTTVTIHGHGFSGVRAVKFGEKLATGVTVKSETEITAIAPAGSGAVEVSVVTGEGITAPTPADKFTY
jgi:sugar lactone lactonase YvrE